uniref:Immunoglobulin I-set domain-containing protein n=1 Tax=Parascaris equorum TaxID=6256 RepID=A0A914R1Y3_PAREQ
MLCNPSNPPNDFDVYNIFDRKINCLPYMNYISECLADGRNHMHCCMTEAKDRDENASVDTRNTKVTLSGLRADSKYSASVVAVTRDGNRRSLASEEVHFHTAGVAPRVTAYRTIHRSARVEWKKVDENTGRFETLSGEKYSLTNYISFHGQPRHYVSAMQIKPLDVSDFGTYRCVASNDFGSSSSDIRLTVRMVTPATAVPPESPYMCCQRQRIRSPCAAVCGTEYGKRASL